jgi:hypothetical protein
VQRHTLPFYAVNMGECTNGTGLKRAFSGGIDRHWLPRSGGAEDIVRRAGQRRATGT